MGRLSLKVVPGSSRDEIVGRLGDSLKVKAPPEKGRANEAVVALLAERLGTDVLSIAVVSGHGSPAKVAREGRRHGRRRDSAGVFFRQLHEYLEKKRLRKIRDKADSCLECQRASVQLAS